MEDALELFKKAIEQQKISGYSIPADEVKSVSALGCLMNQYFGYTGETIFIAMLHGLEDANFHSFIGPLIETWNELSGDNLEHNKALNLRKIKN